VIGDFQLRCVQDPEWRPDPCHLGTVFKKLTANQEKLMNVHALRLRSRLLGIVFAMTALIALQAANGYVVRNLVSDIPDLADKTDPNLVGAWGISESPKSPFWIADAGTGGHRLATYIDAEPQPCRDRNQCARQSAPPAFLIVRF
jgi:hypothetical protein